MNTCDNCPANLCDNCPKEYVTLDREFVGEIISLSIAAARLIGTNPEVEMVYELLAPDLDETERLIDSAVMEFGL